MSIYEYYTLFYRLLRSGMRVQDLLPLTEGGTHALLGLAHAQDSKFSRNLPEPLETAAWKRKKTVLNNRLRRLKTPGAGQPQAVVG